MAHSFKLRPQSCEYFNVFFKHRPQVQAFSSSVRIGVGPDFSFSQIQRIRVVADDSLISSWLFEPVRSYLSHLSLHQLRDNSKTSLQGL